MHQNLGKVNDKRKPVIRVFTTEGAGENYEMVVSLIKTTINILQNSSPNFRFSTSINSTASLALRCVAYFPRTSLSN